MRRQCRCTYDLDRTVTSLQMDAIMTCALCLSRLNIVPYEMLFRRVDVKHTNFRNSTLQRPSSIHSPTRPFPSLIPTINSKSTTLHSPTPYPTTTTTTVTIGPTPPFSLPIPNPLLTAPPPHKSTPQQPRPSPTLHLPFPTSPLTLHNTPYLPPYLQGLAPSPPQTPTQITPRTRTNHHARSPSYSCTHAAH